MNDIEFIFNKNGVCTNPEVVLSLSHGRASVKILAAEWEGFWDMSYNVSYPGGGGGRLPWKRLCTQSRYEALGRVVDSVTTLLSINKSIPKMFLNAVSELKQPQQLSLF